MKHMISDEYQLKAAHMNQTKDKRKGVWVTPAEFFAPLQKEFSLEVDTAASKSHK